MLIKEIKQAKDRYKDNGSTMSAYTCSESSQPGAGFVNTLFRPVQYLYVSFLCLLDCSSIYKQSINLSHMTYLI